MQLLSFILKKRIFAIQVEQKIGKTGSRPQLDTQKTNKN